METLQLRYFYETAKNESVTKTAQKFMDQAASYDELAKATSKTLADYLKAAKAAIKNVGDLKALAKNPDIYATKKLEHIFFGNNGGGLHYNGLAGANGKIVEITKPVNKYGVYGAIVEVDGVKKYSSFFPDNWTPQQVLDTIDAAYYNGVKNNRNQIIYKMDSGMKITINLDEYDKVISAYPVYE